MNNSLLHIVHLDVNQFLEQFNELLFNERDFQMHLATWLRNSANSYDDVDVEYFVPWHELEKVGKYIWKTELRLDIVVKKEGIFVPIELKYKTKKLERRIHRFEELLDDKVVVMKNQGAQDLGMYDFWKDVRRLELVNKRFEHVKGGLAVFVTNDSLYTQKSKPTSNHYLFSMVEGEVCSKQKHWSNPVSKCAQTHPDFDVEKEYSIKWCKREIDAVSFHYCIVEV
jgi:hypothetical protein